MTRPAKQISKRARKVTHGATAQLQILEAVDDLFYREGARAVGVDAVAKRAGVNKMALYRQFESKDALLLLYLARMDETFWGYFELSASKHAGHPAEQLIQFFVDLADRAAQRGFRGCPFVNVAVEFPDPEHPARKMVAKNKAQVMRRLLELAKAAGAPDAQRLANSLAFLIEGAYAASQTFAPKDRLLASLPDVARCIVEAGLRRSKK